MNKYYRITFQLLEDVIISERAATVGGHRSLDYIPGSNLLGACAAQLYNSLSKADAFQVFHSGKVRFGHGLPTSITGENSYPIPLAWHSSKGMPYTSDHSSQQQTLTPDSIFNLTQATEDEKIGGQPKQLRSGYLTDALEYLQPQTRLRMKTAINPATGRASEGQLYGYQSLLAGQSFSSTLSFHNIDEELENAVTNQFKKQLYLGRSRSAQYGKVGCNIIPTDAPDSYPDKAEQTSLWLTSELALHDQFGQPINSNTIFQAFQDCGITLSSIDWARSFLRFREYSPYNSTRRKYDLQRQVIEKGSVLIVSTESPLNQQQIDSLQAGIGLYCEAGLGRFLVNHPWLEFLHPQPLEAFTANQQSKQLQRPDHQLASWLMQRTSQNAKRQVDQEVADIYCAQIPNLYENAKRYAGIDQSSPFGPTATQWSLVLDLGKRYPNNLEILQNKLFGTGDPDKDKNSEVICRIDDSDWTATTFTDDNNQTQFRHWLQEVLNNKKCQCPGHVISLIARSAITESKQPIGAKS